MAHPAAFVFIQEGCGACHDYMPRFYRATRRFPMNAFPIGVYDLARDRHGTHFAETLGVKVTPTTIVQDSRGRLHKKEGALAQSEIDQLLRLAV